jgi:hypothetical protein
MKINRSETPLTTSTHSQVLFYSLIGLAFVGYFLPWLVGGGTSLTFGAYDLAEWVSLRLPARPLEIVLLLRAIPVLLAILIGLLASNQRRWSAAWWASLFAILLIAIGLLPPFEFFLDSSQRGDVNYSQQFRLAGAALIFSLFALSGILRRFYAAALIVGVMLIGITIIGFVQIWVIVESLGVIPQMGLGPVLLIGSIALLCLVSLASSLSHNYKNKKDFTQREVPLK